MVKVYAPSPDAKVEWDSFLISACEVLTALKRAADEIAVKSGDIDRATPITGAINAALRTLQNMDTVVRQKFDNK